MYLLEGDSGVPGSIVSLIIRSISSKVLVKSCFSSSRSSTFLDGWMRIAPRLSVPLLKLSLASTIAFLTSAFELYSRTINLGCFTGCTLILSYILDNIKSRIT